MKRLFFKCFLFLINRKYRYEESRKWMDIESGFATERNGYWYRVIYIYTKSTSPIKEGFIAEGNSLSRWEFVMLFIKYQKDPKYKLK